MEHKRIRIRYWESALKYIEQLSESEQAIIRANVEMLSKGQISNYEFSNTKQLRGPIRELKCGNHRITYFKLDNTLYFIRGFRKKTNKTPRGEIEYALGIYKRLRKD